MTWIDDGFNRQERRLWIAQHAGEALAALQAEITERVTEFRQKARDGNRVRISYGQVIRLLEDGGQEKIEPKLSRDKLAIEVGGSRPITLELFADGGRVCLKQGYGELTIEEAARLILEPFFFPDV